MRVSHEFTVERDGKKVELLAEASGTYDPGSYCGPMDGSYPAEGDITELTIFNSAGEVWDGELTEDEHEKLEATLMEKVAEGDDD